MNEKLIYKVFPFLVFIASFCFVFLTQLKNDQIFKNLPYSICETIILSLWFTVNFYLHYDFIAPKYLNIRKIRILIFVLMTYLIASPIVIDLALKLNKTIFSIPVSYQITAWGFLGGVFGALITGGIGISLRMLIDTLKDKQIKTELENKNLENELKLLKARLNPHFLFNTINNIDTLIEDNPEKASELLSKLSDLLRYVIYETNYETIHLADEIKIIEKYIELQKIRVSLPENVQFDLNCEYQNHQIPPMLFLTFIENAFKHSDLNKSGQAIKIKLKSVKSRIEFSCRNHFISNKNSEGIGLELVKKRLELFYKDKFNLEINVADSIYIVNLLIRTNEN